MRACRVYAYVCVCVRKPIHDGRTACVALARLQSPTGADAGGTKKRKSRAARAEAAATKTDAEKLAVKNRPVYSSHSTFNRCGQCGCVQRRAVRVTVATLERQNRSPQRAGDETCICVCMSCLCATGQGSCDRPVSTESSTLPMVLTLVGVLPYRRCSFWSAWLQAFHTVGVRADRQ
jgi:hypothetical protein